MAFVNLIIAFANYFFGGYVFMKVWEWFPSQIFNLHSITYIESLGLLLLISFFQRKNFKQSKNIDKENEETLYSLVMMSVWLIVTLGFGFILQAFMI
jgi:hypothetical protein